MTRVLYIGNFTVPFTTESHVSRALTENGCGVHQVTQDMAHSMGAARFAGWDTALRAELIVYTRTHNATALGPEWTDTWRSLEASGVRTTSLHLDRFWDLEREHLITAPQKDPLFTTGHVFTADGGQDERWKAAGVNHHWLPPGTDRLECETMPGRVRPEYEVDVLFAGSGSTYHGQYPQRNDLIRFLTDRYGSRFAHYGHGGGRPVVRMQELNDLYASARVIVGDSCFANGRPDGVTNDGYISDRVPETIGRGGFLVHPYVPGIADLFTSGRDYVTHAPGDWEDLDAQIGAYLAAPGEREGIIEQGRERVLREHTYTHRAAELLRVVGLAGRKDEDGISDGVSV